MSNSKEYAWTDSVYRVTAYCPCNKCCGKHSDGLTSTGSDAKKRGIAVDPSIIPIGSTVYVPGYGTAIADDVGGAIKGKRIDVRFKSHLEARLWGVKNLVIKIQK